MKTSIKTLFAAALTTIILGTASVAANATENNTNYTNLTSVKNISKITSVINVAVVHDAIENLSK